MEILSYLLIAVYLFALISLFTYGINCYVLMLLHRFHRNKARQKEMRRHELFIAKSAQDGLPRVTIQLPLFNERYVVERLLRGVATISYPKERLEIQILDDSIDDTVKIVQKAVQKYQNEGFDIVHLHRTDRRGYKAGALESGLARARGEFIAIFDADFIPPSDFLHKTLPYFTDSQVGMVQARWGHINRTYSLLTRVQSLGIDGHFGVEQPARSWGGLFMNFNGTAGVWRKTAIEDAGGWEHDTLTEDMDLSYRAQLKGWKLEFSPTMVCPAELPVQIHAFKAQQNRWAKGSIQTARKLLGRILRARIPWFVKLEAFLHLTHYMVHPLMLIVVLASLPMLFTQWFYASLSYPIMFFTLITLATCGPSSLYFYSQRLLYRDWLKNLKYLPLLVCLGTGIAVSNTKAVLEAFGRRTGTFVRTPKYDIWSRADDWRRKIYRSPESLLSIAEFLMGCYALAALILFLTLGKYFISPFLVIYTLGFFTVFALSMSHSMGPEERKSR
ncbi:MAG: glycosyltransferase [Proteobacteria bacterium]|nr:glycosyltransferase [Pseudomonadota bacterium]NIS71085.1 glycosyltransferase [Pseudomonadota bacterium]